MLMLLLHAALGDDDTMMLLLLMPRCIIARLFRCYAAALLPLLHGAAIDTRHTALLPLFFFAYSAAIILCR